MKRQYLIVSLVVVVAIPLREEREMKQWQDGASQCVEEEDPSTFYILFNRRERLHKLAADAVGSPR
mgnify:CR=1 FL=1